MCLEISPLKQRSLAKKLFGKNDTITAYKVAITNGNQLGGYFQPYHYTVGENTSSRARRRLSLAEFVIGAVSEGIHVFLDNKDAEKLAKTCMDGRILEVTCHRKDLTAIGTFYIPPNPIAQCAVFSKVSVTQEAYNRALKRKD